MTSAGERPSVQREVYLILGAQRGPSLTSPQGRTADREGGAGIGIGMPFPLLMSIHVLHTLPGGRGRCMTDSDACLIRR